MIVKLPDKCKSSHAILGQCTSQPEIVTNSKTGICLLSASFQKGNFRVLCIKLSVSESALCIHLRIVLLLNILCWIVDDRVVIIKVLTHYQSFPYIDITNKISQIRFTERK